MLTREIIGKRITNIYELVKPEVYGLDEGECFIELDNAIIIDIPYGFSEDIWIKELNKTAISLFADLSDQAVYTWDFKSIQKMRANYQKQRHTIFNRMLKALFGYDPPLKKGPPDKVEYPENKLRHIKDRQITDFIWYGDESEKGFLLLDNGYLITETTMSPHGTGLAGLNLYVSIEKLVDRKGSNYSRLSQV